MSDPLRLYWRLFENASDDMKACLITGCQMEYDSAHKDGGITLTARTKNPVAVVWDGGRATVYERRASE